MNRLADSKSPYLLQHKTNPVDWYPWGDEAFEKAKKEIETILDAQWINGFIPHIVFHNDSDTTNNRCANTAGVIDGNSDDQEGLIEFVRGKDYFDYDGDCNLTETRDNPLGDIYHSQLVVVGPPGADTAFTGNNQEAYFRSYNLSLIHI